MMRRVQMAAVWAGHEAVVVTLECGHRFRTNRTALQREGILVTGEDGRQVALSVPCPACELDELPPETPARCTCGGVVGPFGLCEWCGQASSAPRREWSR
jgi:hypothetical protein